MIISFYLDNQNHIGIDYSNPESGNPGIGGTQYMIWTMAYYIKKNNPGICVNLFAPIVDNMPKSINVIQVRNLKEGIKLAKDYKSDIFIFRGPNRDKYIYELIDKLELKSIMWSHNFEDFDSAKYAHNCKFLLRNVCVGKEQYDRLRDHEIFNKSTYIYNALDFKIYNRVENENLSDKNVVCYMGSLTRQKGFHRLAKMWKHIAKEVPNATLYIIGGQNLYSKIEGNESSKLGDSRYEQRIFKYLSDSDGNLLNNVKFKGVLSHNEKLKILSNVDVGIANPTGISETFCIVAAEYQALEIPVVTVAKNGLLDTVKNDFSGYLFKSNKKFKEYVIELLKNQDKKKIMGRNGFAYVNDKFNINNICEEWTEMFDDILQGKNVKPEYEASNWNNNFKWLREFNRKLKCKRMFRWIPSILWYEKCIYKTYKTLKGMKK